MEENNSFKPYVSADKVLPEFTVSSILIGIILAIVFGAANAYFCIYSSSRYWYGCVQADRWFFFEKRRNDSGKQYGTDNWFSR